MIEHNKSMFPLAEDGDRIVFVQKEAEGNFFIISLAVVVALPLIPTNRMG